MAASRSDTAFLGHPAGLGWLSFSEFWERFSYYGMQALLVLYMTHSLLLPGHVQHVLGMTGFRHVLERLYGPLSAEALASNVTGLYTGFVYLTPLAGGLLADRFIGRTWAVTTGAILMAAGQFLMTLDATFLLALLCLLVGVGFFKGNIATQVGDLYGEDDPRRADAFQVYMFGIQLAVIVSPLICGTVGERVSWHWGFALAGFGMLVGLATYLIGRRRLPAEPARRKKDAPREKRALTASDTRNLIILIGLIPVLAVALIGNQQIGNAYLLWAEKNFQIVWFGQTMPISWMLSLDAFISAILIGASVIFWRWWARHWAEPDEMLKIAIGVVIAAGAPVVLAAASAVVASTGHPVSLAWAVAFHTINDLGFANVFPVGLALYTRAAPKGLTGMMIGVFYLHLFLGNLLVGWLGGFLYKMPPVSFWLMHAGLMAGAAVVLIVIRYTVGRSLSPAYAAPEAA
ncbi:MAG TPA: oligopeptide:H+ symporter [Rhizomicrobium sp.]|jgi:POT family proton-dependent oligopeptide transporter|nr:oligopeptide:H+ symporter [Rhizomicrobium sp.]